MYYCEICKKELNEKTKNSGWGKTLCSKHYQQFLKHGHALDTIQRTTNDLNDYIINREDNSVTIFLYNRHCEKVGETIIDLDDLDKVIKKKWRLWKNKVVNGNSKIIQLHRYIIDMNYPKESLIVVDHIDSNPLNNRKSNLRITTQHNNTINRSLQSNNFTEFTGVWYDKSRNKFSSEIVLDAIKCYLGRYNKKEEAVYIRYYAELLLFKEFRSFQNDNKILEITNKISKSRKKELETHCIKRIKERFNLEINS